ncbi:MAG: AIR synthase related protein, partial [Cyanobacteria bacterium P01_C01_bin.72]
MNDHQEINLEKLTVNLRKSLGIVHKQDIQIASRLLNLNNSAIAVGDDCAAIPDGDGYLLLAAEGMWDVLVKEDPWFAGWCAVMVNISDIAAMGGVAIAVVDTIWT